MVRCKGLKWERTDFRPLVGAVPQVNPFQTLCSWGYPSSSIADLDESNVCFLGCNCGTWGIVSSCFSLFRMVPKFAPLSPSENAENGRDSMLALLIREVCISSPDSTRNCNMFHVFCRVLQLAWSRVAEPWQPPLPPDSKPHPSPKPHPGLSSIPKRALWPTCSGLQKISKALKALCPRNKGLQTVHTMLKLTLPLPRLHRSAWSSWMGVWAEQHFHCAIAQ